MAKRPHGEALGLAAFRSLQAEDEPWLRDCFVPPVDFEYMGEMCSIMVFGAPGTGKSAVREMLLKRCQGLSEELRCVAARWQPNPLLLDKGAGFDSVPGQVASVFDACAVAVLEYLASSPSAWSVAPEWVRRQLIWFVHRFARGDLETKAAYLLERPEDWGSEVVAGILRADVGEDLLPPDNWPLVAAELSKALVRLKLKGLWVVVDGLERWIDVHFDYMVSALGAFFSTLPLFEHAAFAYKVFLPSRLQPHLAAAAGLERNRIQPYRLAWREEQLIEIVERRLAVALGEDGFSLGELCSAEGLLTWLRRGGGNRPRAWLELVRPLIARYVSDDRERPIEEGEWLELRSQAPPRLFLDEANRQAVVGGREVSAAEMTSGGYRLLCYLFKNAGRVVPWDELYYQAYRGLDHTPSSPADEDYEEPFSYESILYSRISDLRKAIEPDPQSPLYLDTVRGSGVALRLSW